MVKVLLLARDETIKDPAILEQILPGWRGCFGLVSIFTGQAGLLTIESGGFSRPHN